MSGMGGVIAGQDRRMAGTGFGRAMRLIARREDDARSEPREAAGEAAAIFGEKIGRKLVDRDHHDQFRRRGRRCNLLPRRRRILRETGPGGSKAKRSEEHTSELQSLMRISYAVICLKKTNVNS